MNKKKKHLTLIQVMIGVAIFAVGLIPLVKIFTQTGIQTSKSKWLLIAECLGRSYIDQIKKAEYNYIKEGLSDFTDVTDISSVSDSVLPQKGAPFIPEDNIASSASDNVNGFPSYYSNFQRRIEVKEIETINKNRIKKIHLTIRWKENQRGKQVEHYINFETFVCNTRLYVYH